MPRSAFFKLDGSLYPSWRIARHRLSSQTQELLLQAETNGHSVYLLDATVQDHRPLICPDPDQPYFVEFRDMDGARHPEFMVALHPNALSVQYLDQTLVARPPYPTFTIGNDATSYFPHVQDLYPDTNGAEIKYFGKEWLTKRDLIVILFEANDGMVRGEFVAPRELSHVLQGFAGIHRVLSYKQIKHKARAGWCNTTFWVAPGLRRSIFGGRQNVTLYPGEDGHMFLVGNSSYEGLLEKKPLFCTIAWMLGRAGGMACHASMAQSLTPDKETVTFAMLCDSGRGKTELRLPLRSFLEGGRLVLGYRPNGGGRPRRYTIPWMHDVPLLCLGDDGVAIPSLKPSPNDTGFEGRNWEGGSFDRNSGAYGPGDLPEIDAMQDASDNWHKLRMINIAGGAGNRIEHWNRVLIDGQPCSNPRLVYTNEMLAGAGVPVARDKLEVRNVFYAFSPISGVTAPGPWSKLPHWLAALYEILGGPDAARSKSVGPAAPSDKVVTQAKVKWGHRGTMAQFDPTAFDKQCDQVLRRLAAFPEVNHFLVIQEQKPDASQLRRKLTRVDKEIEYLPECLLRDILALMPEEASIEWEPYVHPLLGYVPKSVRIGKTKLPRNWYRPELYIPDWTGVIKQWCEHIIGEINLLEARGVSPETKRLFDFVRSFCTPNLTLNKKEAGEWMAEGQMLFESFF